jgi:peroxiredoxin
MKKIILALSIISILIIMLSLTIKKAIDVKSIMPEHTLTSITKVPSFEFKSMDNERIGNLDLETGIATVIIHFSPSCDFCDEEAKIISNYYHEFQNSQVLFVSNHSKKSIKEFQEKHSLEIYPNVYFLQYKKNQFEDLFGTRKLPSIFVFDTQFHLIKKIEEAVSAKTLIKYTRAANDR